MPSLKHILILTKPCPPETLTRRSTSALNSIVAHGCPVYTYVTHVEDGRLTYIERSDGCRVVTGYATDFMGDNLLHFSMVVLEYRKYRKRTFSGLLPENSRQSYRISNSQKDGSLHGCDTAIVHCDE